MHNSVNAGLNIEDSSNFDTSVQPYGVYRTHRDQAADSPGSVGKHRHDLLNVLGCKEDPRR